MARNPRFVSPDDVRRWAQEQGYEVAGRGRFSSDVTRAFNDDPSHKRRSIQYVPGQEPTVALYDDSPAPAPAAKAPAKTTQKAAPAPKASAGKAATKEVATRAKSAPAAKAEQKAEPVSRRETAPAASDGNVLAQGDGQGVMGLTEAIEVLRSMQQSGRKGGQPAIVTVQSIVYV